MKQNTFLVTYKNGKTVTDTVDAAFFPNAEEYCKVRFGLSLEQAKEYGTTVEQVDAEKPAKTEVAAEPKPETKAKK